MNRIEEITQKRFDAMRALINTLVKKDRSKCKKPFRKHLPKEVQHKICKAAKAFDKEFFETNDTVENSPSEAITLEALEALEAFWMRFKPLTIAAMSAITPCHARPNLSADFNNFHGLYQNVLHVFDEFTRYDRAISDRMEVVHLIEEVQAAQNSAKEMKPLGLPA